MNEENNQKQKSINERELEILNFWNENKIFEKTLSENRGNETFTFYDGPPFATGTPHHGHLMQSYIKDSIPRYQTMRGKFVRRVWGWDTHGLPIENLIEKNLELKSKKDIEDLGIEKFTKACQDIVLQYDNDWKKAVPRWGRWVDMDLNYMTMSPTYTESCWWAFSELYKKGLAYEGYKVMHICPRCETPLAASEVALGYVDTKDISVYAKFELKDEPGTYLLAWTTTPWTLPGNTAIVVHQDLEYSKVEVEGHGKLILASKQVENVLKNFKYEVTEKIPGKDLVGKNYSPVFDYYLKGENFVPTSGKEIVKENAWKVWHADFVSADSGTGIAHEAPAFGEDDYILAGQNNIPTIIHVAFDGRFRQEVTDFAGERVKWKGETQATDKKVCEFLQNQNKILKTEVITHSYPLCWRCDTPLLNYATTSWFVAVSKMRERLVAENNSVYWVPDNVREGRMGQWLAGARDWAVSRNRYWGAPLPVWRESDKSFFVPGSLSELQTRTKSKNKYIFVRHGEAVPNLKGLINVDNTFKYGLTEKGKEEARKVSQDLKNKYKIDLILTSPYERTLETANIIAGDLGISPNDILVEEKIKEFQVGLVNEGKTWQEMYYENKAVNILHDKIDGAEETKMDVINRVAKTLYELEDKYEGKTILLVTHNSPMSAIEIYNSGKLYEKSCGNMPTIHKFGNCEILDLDFRPLPHDETGAVNFHLPHIDNLVVYGKDGVPMKREGGVFDCWYESGSMPYAQFHYPFENQELFKRNFPADFIAEAQDQTRGWFYTMLVLGVGLFDKSPFKSVITSGMINAADGKKMSKRLKNYTDAGELIEKFGSDSIRYYILSSPVVKGETIKFADDGIKQVYSKNISRLLNVLSFFKMTEAEKVLGDASSSHPLDKYIVARLRQVKMEVQKGFEELFLDQAFRPIEKFIDDFSVWYLRRSRERLKNEDHKIKNEALSTLKFVLKEFAKITAPIFPFTSEILWQELKDTTDRESVHLTSWTDAETVDEKDIQMVEKMDWVREVVSKIMEGRVNAKIKVRQPLRSVTLKTAKYDALKTEIALQNEILDETNIKEIIFTQADESGVEVVLDTEITEELKIEGEVRELVRMIQDKRKEAGLKMGDTVSIEFPNSTSDFSKKVLESHADEIKKECGLSSIGFGEDWKIFK